MTDITNRELLIRIDERVKNVEEIARANKKALDGNGKQGLISQVQSNRHDIDDLTRKVEDFLEERKETLKEQRAFWRAVVLLFVGAVIANGCTIVAILSKVPATP